MDDDVNMEEIKKATLDAVTEFENRPEFVENLHRMISKSDRAGKHAGIYLLRVKHDFDETLPDGFVKNVANYLNTLDFDHSARYGDTFAMLVRVSTEADNNIRTQWIKDGVQPIVDKYNYSVAYIHTLTTPKDQAEAKLSELEQKALELTQQKPAP